MIKIGTYSLPLKITSNYPKNEWQQTWEKQKQGQWTLVVNRILVRKVESVG